MFNISAQGKKILFILIYYSKPAYYGVSAKKSFICDTFICADIIIAPFDVHRRMSLALITRLRQFIFVNELSKYATTIKKKIIIICGN